MIPKDAFFRSGRQDGLPEIVKTASQEFGTFTPLFYHQHGIPADEYIDKIYICPAYTCAVRTKPKSTKSFSKKAYASYTGDKFQLVASNFLSIAFTSASSNALVDPTNVQVVDNQKSHYKTSPPSPLRIQKLRGSFDTCYAVSECGKLLKIGRKTVEIPLPLSPSDRVKYLYTGEHFALVVTEERKVYGYGTGGYLSQVGIPVRDYDKVFEFQLPQLQPGEHIVKIAASFCNAFFLTNFSRLIYSGKNSPNTNPLLLELPSDLSGKKIISIASSQTPNCILTTESNELYGAGSNEYGELGLRDKRVATHVFNFRKLELEKVIGVACLPGTQRLKLGASETALYILVTEKYNVKLFKSKPKALTDVLVSFAQ